MWRAFEEFDTSDPPDGLPDDYFATIVEEFLATGEGQPREDRRGGLGAGPGAGNRGVRG